MLKHDGVLPGTTSACAENTLDRVDTTHWRWNYLRMRGEYIEMLKSGGGLVELPPHARRIHSGVECRVPHRGTTSACAENTRIPRLLRTFDRNYLRMRGEYARDVPHLPTTAELPPHARRIHHAPASRFVLNGTTSACAENTPLASSGTYVSRNYLRMRGEYSLVYAADELARELPPHARRIPSPSISWVKVMGTTSACAENTSR